MAKKKEKKEKDKKTGYHVELIGLLLVLIAIIGLGRFGPIGNLINGFAVFIAGAWCWAILIYVFGIGIYMILNREAPDFFSPRLCGLYIMFFSILIISHINYIKVHGSNFNTLRETVNQLLLAFQDNYTIVDAGGGMVGALLAVSFDKLFANGAIIIVFALIIFSIVLLTNIPISEQIKWVVKKIRKLIKREKVDKTAIDKADEEYEKDNKIVISNIDELTQVTDNEKGLDNEEEIPNEYILPSIMLLNLPNKDKKNSNQGVVKNNIEIIERVLNDFDIAGKVVQVHVGPSVTQYELEIKAGTKVNKVLNINRELALALAAKTVRVQAPIPGKNTIGIEIPNRVNTMVSLREVMSLIPNSLDNNKLLTALGIDIMGKPIYAEINKMPHLLVAGATGSGKSVCINSMIVSILMRSKPDEVKLVLIDPKKVELSVYNCIPHLLAPVVNDPKKAAIALMKIVSEMDQRYEMFNETETKSIAGYNQYIENKNKQLNDDEKLSKLPYIVVIIDELADLMLVASKEVEDSIMRITQMARAAGIHLIVATQRPSTDVITGLLKANIPSRISFAVSSSIDSRTILDMSGAEKLLGKGDMLFLPMGENVPIRLQGSLITEEEVKRVVNWTIKQQKAKYDEKLTVLDNKINYNENHEEEEEDPLYSDVVEFIIKQGKASASLIQRKYRIGYNRAARIVDLLEERGIIGPVNGSKPREVLVELEEKDTD
ncbi:MAG: DNA translocase FtsK [Bacilli bacterium]|jgi:S-DNA-T family DNA segregation ATPase FtsK/SpoIIIE|nr:DNA translocase FtsK [Bacilli bacterium]